MTANHHQRRRELIEELGWHCEDPKAALAVCTDEEQADILKRGFVTKDLWASLKPRIPRPLKDPIIDLEAEADKLLEEVR